MKYCPFCSCANYDHAHRCRKCDGNLTPAAAAAHRRVQVGPEAARQVRAKALAFIALALLMKTYWGGYGPWPVVDNPTLLGLRGALEPLFALGGALAYAAGLALQWV